MVLRLADWGKAKTSGFGVKAAGPAAMPRAATPRREAEPADEPVEKENTGLSRILFGRGTTKDSAKNAAAQKEAVARANPRPRLTTERLNASLGSGGRGGVPGRAAGIAPEKMREQAKKGDAYEAAQTEEGRESALARLAAKGARRRELSAEEWATLTPSQQRQVEFNGTLLEAIDADRVAGSTASSKALLDQLGLAKGTVSVDDFAAGVTAVRDTDLFGKDAMRAGASVLVDGSQQESSWLHQTGLKKTQPWQVGSNATGRQQMIANISAGVERYFAQMGPTLDTDSLNSILGKTSVSTRSDQTDQYLAEIYDSAARRSTWEGGATYDQLMQALEGVQISPDVFAQYAGERAAAAESSGIPLIDDAGDSLDVAAFRTALGLTEN